MFALCRLGPLKVSLPCRFGIFFNFLPSSTNQSLKEYVSVNIVNVLNVLSENFLAQFLPENVKFFSSKFVQVWPACRSQIRLYFLFFSASVKQTKSQETIPHILSAFFSENLAEKILSSFWRQNVVQLFTRVLSCPHAFRMNMWPFAQLQEHISTHFLQFFC